MSQISARTAELLAPAQAAELVGVIDTQARWENLRGDPPRASDNTPTALQARQKAYDAFRTKLATYTATYRTSQVPEPTLNTPERLAEWCRAVRAVLLRADPAVCPGHINTKVYRLADRIAARLGRDAVGRPTPADDVAGTVQELCAVVAWCEEVSAPAPLTLKAHANVTEPLEKVA